MPSQLCYASDWWRDAFLLSAAGYFLQDLWSELNKDKKNGQMIFHHVFVGIFLVAAASWNMFTHPLAVLLLNEGSTPFLSRRWNFKRIESDRGLSPTERRSDFVNGILFVLTFFFCRIVLIPLIWAQTLAAGCLSFSMANGDAFKAVMIFCGNLNFPILWAMNLYWFQIIASQAWGVLKGDNQSQSKAVVDHLS